jgi:hypothetical protein
MRPSVVRDNRSMTTAGHLPCGFVNRRGSQRLLHLGQRLETGRFISDWRTVRTREMD